MSKFFGRVALAGVVVAAVVALYTFLLPEEAKENLHDIAKKGIQIGRDVQETIMGAPMSNEEQRIEANRAYVAKQWEQAGF